jgi:hypothetical protein
MIGWMPSFAFLLSGLLSLAGRITRACSSFLARWRMCGEVVGRKEGKKEVVQRKEVVGRKELED